ncbi:selenoprotein S [Protopterus annectens]|uniref:selenoprotein S n=1 Tax=Protopterus annectens TaxID=7888 RepID=UPI001CF9ADB2|nr:selenoprotein S [Protopterus annectens]
MKMEMEEDDKILDRKPVVESEGLQFLQQTVGFVFSDYGWYIFFGVIALYLLVQRMRQIKGLKRKVSVSTEDPSVVVRREEALEAARRRMQEELNAKAELYREKQKQLEEEKRKQKIEMWESMQEGKSYKGKLKLNQDAGESSASNLATRPKPKSDKKSLRGSDYNPLSGSGGGSCSWRPGRRGPSAGG